MIIVAVGILTRKITPDAVAVLLCQRRKSARYALKWEFPGGKVEEGEMAADGLRRELREELDIDATIGNLYHRQHYVYPDSGTFDVYYYTISSYSGTLVNNVFETTAWVPVSELGAYDILEGNTNVIGMLMSDHAKSAVEKN
jgi:8-oxo-dGTP diphosphatase